MVMSCRFFENIHRTRAIAYGIIEISNPRAVAPRAAAANNNRPSPQPRSYTVCPDCMLASFITRSISRARIGTHGAPLKPAYANVAPMANPIKKIINHIALRVPYTSGTMVAHPMETELQPNQGKHIKIEVVGTHYARFPIKTRVITEHDAMERIVTEYAAPHLKPGDFLF